MRYFVTLIFLLTMAKSLECQIINIDRSFANLPNHIHQILIKNNELCVASYEGLYRFHQTLGFIRDTSIDAPVYYIGLGALDGHVLIENGASCLDKQNSSTNVLKTGNSANKLCSDGHRFFVSFRNDSIYRVSRDYSIIEKKFQFGNGRINDMLCDSKGRIWVAKANGVLKYNPTTDGFEKFDKIKGEAFCIYEMKDTIFFGQRNLVLAYFVNSEKEEIIQEREICIAKKHSKMKDDDVKQILSDKNNNLWILTSNKIAIINSEQCQRYTFIKFDTMIKPEYLTCMAYNQNDDKVYVGTAGRGVFSLQTKDLIDSASCKKELDCGKKIKRDPKDERHQTHYLGDNQYFKLVVDMGPQEDRIIIHDGKSINDPIIYQSDYIKNEDTIEDKALLTKSGYITIEAIPKNKKSNTYSYTIECIR